MFQHLAPDRIFSLEDKVAFITGAAGGIATGLTQGFAAAGARLVLVDRSEAVHDRARQLREAGAEASSIAFDITDAAAVADASAERKSARATARYCAAPSSAANMQTRQSSWSVIRITSTT